ncbi:MAG: CAP domain-containing protein, partial [Thermoproteota archaeon]
MRRADLSIAIIVFVLLTSFVPYNVSGAADIGGYLNEVLIAQPQFLEHYRTIPIASLESNLDVAFTKLMDCYNDTRKSYEDCLPLEIDYDFISSIYWNRLEDTGMQIATYITQVTDAYDLCVYDGNSETDCSTYLLDIQLAFRDQFEAQYRQEMWTYAIFIDGYGPSYDITWTDENAYRGSFVWTVAKTYGESYDNDDRDIPPETNVIAFSKEPLSVEELEKQLQDMINDYRVENGLKRLEWDDRLAEIARLHSQEQVAFRYLSHTNLEGQDPTERGEEMDYE